MLPGRASRVKGARERIVPAESAAVWLFDRKKGVPAEVRRHALKAVGYGWGAPSVFLTHHSQEASWAGHWDFRAAADVSVRQIVLVRIIGNRQGGIHPTFRQGGAFH